MALQPLRPVSPHLQPGVDRAVIAKIQAMRDLAARRCLDANGSREWLLKVENDIDIIAKASITKIAPVNHKLLDLTYMLLCEARRLRALHGTL